MVMLSAAKHLAKAFAIAQNNMLAQNMNGNQRSR
jgi:hypothetical protein